MTFSESVKKEFAAEMPRSTCCRRALAYGLLFDANTDAEGRIWFDTSGEDFAERFARLLERQFSKNVSCTGITKAGRKYFRLEFTFASMAEKISDLSLENAKIKDYIEFKCAECRVSFLRGIFLARGTLTFSPSNNHLEYRIIHKERADLLADFLTACGVPPKRTDRERVIGLYFKRGEQIEDNLKLMQANETFFSVINERIEREIKMQENRAVNCESVNILKAVEAAQKQIKAIKAIEKAGLLDKLDSGLYESARLRLENSDSTMNELALLHNPPISKSGLNARFAKIIKIAEQISKKN